MLQSLYLSVGGIYAHVFLSLLLTILRYSVVESSKFAWDDMRYLAVFSSSIFHCFCDEMR